MAAYLIFDVEQTNDRQMHDEYRRRAAPTLEQYGVKFVVGSGACETIEGNWHSQGMVILEFEDTEHFKRWYDSPEYKEIRKLRFQALTTRVILIQGD